MKGTMHKSQIIKSWETLHHLFTMGKDHCEQR